MSLNHRMVEVGRHLLRPSSPTPPAQAGSARAGNICLVLVIVQVIMGLPISRL